MAVDDTLMLRGWGNVDVQVGGPGNPWVYLSACAAMSGPTVPFGEVERRWCQDPTKANGFRVSSKFTLAPDLITGELMTKLGKVNYLENLNCPFAIRARYIDCGERQDTTQYVLMLAYCDVDLTEKSYEDLVVTDPANQDEILTTTAWSANYEMRIKPVIASRIGSLTDLGDQAINDIEYCDEVNCAGNCGTLTDGCSVFYGVTDLDTAVYAWPNFIKGVKNVLTGALTYTLAPIIGNDGNVEGIECAGSRLVISSNATSQIGYNDSDGDQDEWNFVVLDNAPSANNNALFFRTAQEGYVACNSGYIYKTIDGGTTWTAVHSATETVENLNAIYAFNSDLVYAVGNNGVILKSVDGGTSWSNLTQVAVTAANLLSVIVPPGRSLEVYIGANNGNIYKSVNEGVTIAQMAFSGDGVGSIDDLAFCGECGGDVLWILHNDSGPRGRILRDLSGGAGGQDIEVVAGYTSLFPAGVQLNALTCCNQNEVLAAGELNGGFPVLLRTS